MIDFIKAKAAFEKYLDGYDRTNDKIKLKIVHTYGVMDYAWEHHFVTRIVRRIPYRTPQTAAMMTRMENYMNDYVKKGAGKSNENTDH